MILYCQFQFLIQMLINHSILHKAAVIFSSNLSYKIAKGLIYHVINLNKEMMFIFISSFSLQKKLN